MLAEIVTGDGRLIATIEDEVNLPNVGDLFVLPDFSIFRIVQRAFIGALAPHESLKGPIDLSKPRGFTMKIQLRAELVKQEGTDAVRS